MRKLVCMMVMWAAAAPAAAQQLQLPMFEHLAAKAKETTNVTLDGSLLKLASPFLSGKDPLEAAVKKLIENVKGIYVRAFEFDRDGAYSEADLKQVRAQLSRPGWSRIVTSHARDTGEDVGVWLYQAGDKIAGLAVVASEPRELTIVNIVGAVGLDDLAALGGKFGVPKVLTK